MNTWVLFEEAEKRVIAEVGDVGLGTELLGERLRNGDIQAQATYLVVSDGNTKKKDYLAPLWPEFFQWIIWGPGKNRAKVTEKVEAEVVRFIHKVTGAEWTPASDETDDDDDYELVRGPELIDRVSEAYNIKLSVDDLEKCWPGLFQAPPKEPPREPEDHQKPRTRNARGKGGAPTKHAWSEAAVQVAIYIHDNGLPDQQGPLQETLKQWFALKYREPPGDKDIRDFTQMVLDALKAHLKG